MSSDSQDLAIEQKRLSTLYARLDDLRMRAEKRLAGALGETGGTHAARTEREDLVTRYSRQLAQFDAVENGLCFGRLDFVDGECRYIGRIGLFDEDDDYRPLLLDWRAPAARPFYLATAAHPDGVRRRRQIRTRRRAVVGLTDEVLDLTEAASSAGRARSAVTGEATLLAALNAGRTGFMRDIVSTIQAEQDQVIRADMSGVLVVQGGPGTGKTAVALHRAAYLLYTHRDQLTRHGVLVLGPNPTFLRYISQVLPALAETGVLLATLGDMFPGVTARRPEAPGTAEIKGRPGMAAILARAVADRQQVPDEAIEIEYEGEPLRLDRYTCTLARTKARRSHRRHNLARSAFVDHIVGELARQYAERIGTDLFADDPLGGDDAPGDAMLLDAAEIADIARALRAEPAVAAALDELWPVLSPQRLLADLYASDERLATAAPELTERERRALRADPRRDGWTPADVPLLDEVAELLGPHEPPGQVRLRRRETLAEVEYAQGVLDISRGSRSIDLEDAPEEEILQVADLLAAGALADRQAEVDRRTAAERAATDRNWPFGHVIVDEAQELSHMAWRLLMRRCPSRSMTVVGDVAQTGELGGTRSWAEVFTPYVGDRWRLAELSVNYRTPKEIMELAERVVRVDRPARSVRGTGVPPWREAVAPADLPARLIGRVGMELAEFAREAGGPTDDLSDVDRRLGVIVPGEALDPLGAAVASAVPDAAIGADPDLTAPVVVLTVRQAKGLEFDAVLVVEPAVIVAESPRGASDLYVALTRATQRLGLLHTGDLPAGLRVGA